MDQVAVHHVSVPFLHNAQGPGFRGDLLAASREAGHSLILDLTDVVGIDSHCIGLLVLTSRLLPKGFKLVVVTPGGQVRRALETSHVNRLLPMADTVERAREILTLRTPTPAEA